MRECTCCHELKDESEFSYRSDRKKSLRSWCKQCTRKIDREKKKKVRATPEGKAAVKKSYEAHKETYNAKQRIYNRSDKGKVAHKKYEDRIKEQICLEEHGVSREEWALIQGIERSLKIHTKIIAYINKQFNKPIPYEKMDSEQRHEYNRQKYISNREENIRKAREWELNNPEGYIRKIAKKEIRKICANEPPEELIRTKVLLIKLHRKLIALGGKNAETEKCG